MDGIGNWKSRKVHTRYTEGDRKTPHARLRNKLLNGNRGRCTAAIVKDEYFSLRL